VAGQVACIKFDPVRTLPPSNFPFA
jgi:hypothetical protein